MKKIPLTKGQVALVDDDDYEWLSRWKWRANKHGGRWCAERSDGKKTVFMHRQILGCPSDKCDVDHRNRNTLDNQKHNLRRCTRSQNMMNRPKTRSNKSGFKGVAVCVERRYARERRFFKAQLSKKSLGNFTSAVAAALKYNEAAIAKFGEFARVNDMSQIFDGT